MPYPSSLSRLHALKRGFALVVGFTFGVADGPREPVTRSGGLIEAFVAVHPDGNVTVNVGPVDLGTGTRTALAQIAADELDAPFPRVTMVMGDTATTPDQWLDSANLALACGGTELRRACATARAALIERGARKLGVPASELVTGEGRVRLSTDANRSASYAELVAGEPLELKVDPAAPLKTA